MYWGFILLIIAAVLICLLVQSGNKKSIYKEYENKEYTCSCNRYSRPLNKHYSAKTSWISDIYAQIQNTDIDAAVQYLQEEAQHIRKVIPHFPKFPRLWLLPPTSKGEYRSLGERHCIEFLNLLFPNHHFKTIRPKWLRNPKTNRCLELDGYNAELSLAIEYNGIQHYVWPNFTGCTLEEFLEQRYRDQVKERKCIGQNICLIRIPYTIPLERIPLAIYAKLIDAAAIT